MAMISPEQLPRGLFFGVYLLCSMSAEKNHKGKCYIGYTVNPARRLQQHNRGKQFGGAWRTNNKGPWKMILIVHGFPNNISALQFEWAWQNPAASLRLKTFTDLKCKSRKETHFQHKFRILSKLLQVGPWYRMPLTVRWLEMDCKCDFEPPLPAYMHVVSGGVQISKSNKVNQLKRKIWSTECHLCMKKFNDLYSRFGCVNADCKLTCHTICLANHLLTSYPQNEGHYIPIYGECPLCDTKFTWVAIVQHNDLLQNADAATSDDDSSDLDEKDIEMDGLGANAWYTDLGDCDNDAPPDDVKVDLTQDSDECDPYLTANQPTSDEEMPYTFISGDWNSASPSDVVHSLCDALHLDSKPPGLKDSNLEKMPSPDHGSEFAPKNDSDHNMLYHRDAMEDSGDSSDVLIVNDSSLVSSSLGQNSNAAYEKPARQSQASAQASALEGKRDDLTDSDGSDIQIANKTFVLSKAASIIDPYSTAQEVTPKSPLTALVHEEVNVLNDSCASDSDVVILSD